MINTLKILVPTSTMIAVLLLSLYSQHYRIVHLDDFDYLTQVDIEKNQVMVSK